MNPRTSNAIVSLILQYLIRTRMCYTKISTNVADFSPGNHSLCKVVITFLTVVLLSGCKPQPDDPIKQDQDYTLTIQGTSSLDKKIQDGTTAWFVEKGKTDTTFKALQNEQASLKIHAAEGRSVQGTAGIRENN